MNRESIDRPLDRLEEPQAKFSALKLVGYFSAALFILFLLDYLSDIIRNGGKQGSLDSFFMEAMFQSIHIISLALTGLSTYYAAKSYAKVNLPNIAVRCMIFAVFYVFMTFFSGIIFNLFEGTSSPHLFSLFLTVPVAGLKNSFLFILIWLTLEYKLTTQQ